MSKLARVREYVTDPVFLMVLFGVVAVAIPAACLLRAHTSAARRPTPPPVVVQPHSSPQAAEAWRVIEASRNAPQVDTWRPGPTVRQAPAPGRAYAVDGSTEATREEVGERTGSYVDGDGHLHYIVPADTPPGDLLLLRAGYSPDQIRAVRSLQDNVRAAQMDAAAMSQAQYYQWLYGH